MMKHLRHIFATLAVIAALSVQAATIGELFAAAPSHIFPTLPDEARAQVVSHWQDSTQQAIGENRFSGEFMLSQLTPNYMLLRTSAKQQMALRLLTAGRDSVIAVVTTVQLPVPDSRIDFYSTQWKPIPAKKVMKPLLGIDLFLRPGLNKQQRQQVIEGIDFPLIALEFTGEQHNVLTATQMMQKFLSPDDYKPLQPSLVKTVSWDLMGTKLKLHTAR